MAPKAPGESSAFPRAQRLTRGSELAIVRQQGKRVRTATMDVRAIASLRVSPRVGVVVPLYKHSAVDRNRLKRRLRELIRVEWLPRLPTMDVVIKVIPPAYERDFDALRGEMRQAAERLTRLVLPQRADTPPGDPSKTDTPPASSP